MRLPIAAVAALVTILPAIARDNGWEDTPAEQRKWFQSLMQPDAPAVSCCGEADAYEADDYEVEGDHYVAIVTDERGDVFPSGATRPHVEPGTHIHIPNGKMKWDAGNPTGHGYVFMGAGGSVYCYIAPGGV